MKASSPRPPLWLFALLRIPYGVYVGFLRTSFPYLLRAEGVPVERIASAVSILAIPATLYFFWSPLVDFGMRRRDWLLLVSVFSAAALAIALTRASLGSDVTILILLVGFSINLLNSAATGGLMASTLSSVDKTRASGWYQAGSLGMGTIAGGLLLLVAQHFSSAWLATAAVALIVLPALAALGIVEPRPQPVAGQFRRELRQIRTELVATFRARENRIGLLLILSPLGAGAAMSVFTGMAPDYHLRAEQVTWLNGIGGGVLLALGALAGGFLPTRWDRISTYLLTGALNALAAVFLWAAPFSPAAYFVGYSLYLFTAGICYAAFTSLVFHLLGNTGRSLSSRYTIMVALSNLPLVYMTAFEGWGYHAIGIRSVAALDAGAGLLVILACGCLTRVLKQFV